MILNELSRSERTLGVLKMVTKGGYHANKEKKGI